MALPQHCEDHSGLSAWVKGVGALVVCANGMLVYSVFWQAPQIRLDMAKEVARLEAKDRDTQYDLQTLRYDMERKVASVRNGR